MSSSKPHFSNVLRKSSKCTAVGISLGERVSLVMWMCRDINWQRSSDSSWTTNTDSPSRWVNYAPLHVNKNKVLRALNTANRCVYDDAVSLHSVATSDAIPKCPSLCVATTWPHFAVRHTNHHHPCWESAPTSCVRELHVHLHLIYLSNGPSVSSQAPFSSLCSY